MTLANILWEVSEVAIHIRFPRISLGFFLKRKMLPILKRRSYMSTILPMFRLHMVLNLQRRI